MTESQSNGVTESLSDEAYCDIHGKYCGCNETSDKNESSPRDCNEAEEQDDCPENCDAHETCRDDRGDEDTTERRFGVPNDVNLHDEMEAAMTLGLAKKLTEAELAAKSPVEGSKGMPAAEFELKRLSKALTATNEELAYLRYFHQEADFGPAHTDVVMAINDRYECVIPEGYEIE